MPSLAKSSEHPLSMRLAKSDVMMIDRAASLRGRSRTEFVRDAAVRAAEQVVMESSLLRFGEASYRQFMAMIAAPPKAIPELVKQLKRPTPWDFAPNKKARKLKRR
jgi:uncharacterized protein (DUF1778 family)